MKYPDQLKASAWAGKDKLPPGAEVSSKLAALARKHEAVEWKNYASSWTNTTRTPKTLGEAYEKLEASLSTHTNALKKAVAEVAAAIKADRTAATGKKVMLASLKSIEDELDPYKTALEGVAAALTAARDSAAKAISQAAEDQDEDVAVSKLIDPKKLLSQLQQCLRDPLRRAQFAFVEALPLKKQPAALVMHATTSGRSLFDKLSAETGSKSGSYGVAWIDGTTLRMRIEKAYSGLATKIRAPIKPTGFKVAKIIILGSDDKPLEQDEEADDKPQVVATTTKSPQTGTARVGEKGKEPAAQPKVEPKVEPKVQPRAQPTRAQPSEVEVAFAKVLFGGDVQKLTPLRQSFDANTLTAMHQAFGGEKGLVAVQRILQDVCGGDLTRLRTLIKELG